MTFSVSLGEMQEVGEQAPPAKLMKALAVIADSLHPLFDMVPAMRPGKSKESCVLASLTIRDFLFRVGFHDAEVVPVLMFLHAQRDSDREILHTLGIGDPNHNVARAAADAKKEKWPGHLIVMLPKIGWLVDATLYQAIRPQWPDMTGMIAVQTNVDRETEIFGLYPLASLIEKEDGKTVTALWLDQPKNKFWRQGADTSRRRREAVVDALVAKFGSWEEAAA